jgi:4a-hydroxytetrahydrobiopterin dehydratase
MKLPDADITRRLQALTGWIRQGAALQRRFEFETFPDAVAFIVRLAFEAEAADHHPDLLVNYRRVTVTWTTHSEDGITEKDFAGIERADRLAVRFTR